MRVCIGLLLKELMDADLRSERQRGMVPLARNLHACPCWLQRQACATRGRSNSDTCKPECGYECHCVRASQCTPLPELVVTRSISLVSTHQLTHIDVGRRETSLFPADSTRQQDCSIDAALVRQRKRAFIERDPRSVGLWSSTAAVPCMRPMETKISLAIASPELARMWIG